MHKPRNFFERTAVPFALIAGGVATLLFCLSLLSSGLDALIVMACS